MTGGDGKNKSQVSLGYLRGLLGDGARPFLFRERVYSLLGVEGGWSGSSRGVSSHRPVGLPCPGALRASHPGRGPGCGERLLSGDVEAGRGGDSLDTLGKSAPGGNGDTHGPAGLCQGGEGDGRRHAAESQGDESISFPAPGAGENNSSRVTTAGEKEREFLCHGLKIVSRTAAAGDGRGAKGGSPFVEKGRAAENEVARLAAAGQAARTDTIVIPGGTGGRGAVHPVAGGAPECGPSPVAADATVPEAVSRSLKVAKREGAGGGHGDGFAFSSVPQRAAPGREAAESAGSGREKTCEAHAPEPEERTAATSGAGFDAGEERRPRLVKIPGGQRGIFAAMGEGASFMEESSLPSRDERNMAGALRTLEDHLRQKIEQLREASARRPESAGSRFAPDTANGEETGEAPRVLPARERIVVVSRPGHRSAAPAAFWERSYMGRLFLRPLR